MDTGIVIRKSTLLSILFVPFFAFTASGLGAYSSTFGPYYSLTLLGLLPALFALTRGNAMIESIRSCNWWLGFALFFLFVFVAESSQLGSSLELFKPMFTQLLVYVIAFAFVNSNVNYMPQLRIGLFFALSISIGVNCYEYFLSPNLFSIAPGRAAGFHLNSNASGMMLAGLWAMWFAMREGRSIIFTIFAGISSFIAIILTFSRSSIIEFVALSTTVFIFNAIRKRKSIALIVGYVVLLFTIVFYIFLFIPESHLSEDAKMRVASLTTGNFNDSSSEGRLDAVMYYWNSFLNSPLTGKWDFSSLSLLTGQGPHNTFVGLAADFGIFPLCLFFIILISGTLPSYKNRAREDSDIISIVIVLWLLISSLFSHNVLYSTDGSLMTGLLLALTANRGRQTLVNRFTRDRVVPKLKCNTV